MQGAGSTHRPCRHSLEGSPRVAKDLKGVHKPVPVNARPESSLSGIAVSKDPLLNSHRSLLRAGISHYDV